MTGRSSVKLYLLALAAALPGVAAGVLLCFIPIVGEFVIPELLAGSDSMMIGQTLWLEFFTNKDWPVASAVAIVLLALLLIRLRARLNKVLDRKIATVSLFRHPTISEQVRFLAAQTAR